MLHPVICAFLVLFVALGVSGLMAIALDICFGYSDHNILKYYSGSRRLKDTATKETRKQDNPIPGSKFENLFTVLQISDLHISKFRKPEIKDELMDFCSNHLSLISPEVVLVTGDIVDAKDQTNLGSQQYREEWLTYKAVLEHCQKQWKGEWLEVRGNHDAFAVLDHEGHENMFRYVSHSRMRYGKSGSYQHVLTKPFGSYSFIALDLAPNPGPRRPYNFFGMVEEEDLKLMKRVSKERHLHNLTIWFGHYPLSTIATTGVVRNIVRQGIVYLCGHLHTLGGLVPEMHLMLPNGHMELESGDWKESKRYRIIGVDHDLLSFVDARYPDLPVVLFTNPIESRYFDPRRQPLGKVRKSTHIRFLVYSKRRILSAQVIVDQLILCNKAEYFAKNLYTCPWHPTDYKKGKHNLTVLIKDEDGKQVSRGILFSLEGKRDSFLSIGSLILFLDFSLIARIFFCCTFFIMVIFPLLLRKALLSDSQDVFSGILLYVPSPLVNFLKKDKVCVPWMWYNIYIALGPIFVGELVPGSIGLCFVHGLLINGYWLQGAQTYVDGGLQLVLFSLPMAFYLGTLCSRGKSLPTAHRGLLSTIRSRLKTLSFHGLYLVVLGYQIIGARSLQIAYGTMAFVLSPGRAWSIPFSVWLTWLATRTS